MNRTRINGWARMRRKCDSMATTSENFGSKESSLRKRYRGETPSLVKQSDNSSSETVQQNEKYDQKEKVRLRTGTYWLTRIVLLRSIAFMYCECYILFCVTIIASGF